MKQATDIRAGETIILDGTPVEVMRARRIHKLVTFYLKTPEGKTTYRTLWSTPIAMEAN